MTTKKFMILQRGCPGQPLSPEQMQEMFTVFNNWKEKFKDNILDLGDALQSTGKVLTESGVTDGPFVESKEIIGGYSILTAQSYEEALEIARQSPGMVGPGSSIEIREMMGH